MLAQVITHCADVSIGVCESSKRTLIRIMIMIMHILVVTNCVGDIAELCRVILPRHWINGTQYATICHIYPTTTPIIHNPHMPQNIGLGLVLESFAWNVLFF